LGTVADDAIRRIVQHADLSSLDGSQRTRPLGRGKRTQYVLGRTTATLRVARGTFAVLRSQAKIRPYFGCAGHSQDRFAIQTSKQPLLGHPQSLALGLRKFLEGGVLPIFW
jgi:hypothetical protein